MTRRNWLTLLLAVGLIALAPLFLSGGYYLHLMVTIGLFILLGTSFDLISGRTGLLFLAPAAFFGIGTYAVALLYFHLGITLWFPFALIVGGLISAAIGYILSIPLLRLSSHTFATATLALGLVVELVANNWVEVTRGPMCVAGIPGPSLSLGGRGLSVTSPQGYFYLMLGLVAVTVVVYLSVVNSRVGRVFSAVRYSDILAAGQGVPVQRYKRLAFVMTAFGCGVAGAFMASYTRVACPDDMNVFYVTLNVLVVAFIGGTRSLPGIIVGSSAVVLIPEILRFTPEARMMLYGAVLLVISITIPDGLGSIIGRIRQRNRERKELV